MGTDSTSRTLLFLASLVVLAGALWLVRDVLPPFLIAFALALLLDPDAFNARIHHLVPERLVPLARELVVRVGHVFTAYLRGLTLICACYGVVVYLVLALGFRLEYGVTLGLLAAVLYVVPYLGQ